MFERRYSEVVRRASWAREPTPSLALAREMSIIERPSYIRQRAVVASGGTLVDVVDSLIEELRTDRPSSS